MRQKSIENIRHLQVPTYGAGLALGTAGDVPNFIRIFCTPYPLPDEARLARRRVLRDAGIGPHRSVEYEHFLEKAGLLGVVGSLICYSSCRCHAWIQRVPNLRGGQGKVAALLGFVLFFAVYGFVWLLQRNFQGKRQTEMP